MQFDSSYTPKVNVRIILSYNSLFYKLFIVLDRDQTYTNREIIKEKKKRIVWVEILNRQKIINGYFYSVSNENRVSVPSEYREKISILTRIDEKKKKTKVVNIILFSMNIV